MRSRSPRIYIPMPDGTSRVIDYGGIAQELAGRLTSAMATGLKLLGTKGLSQSTVRRKKGYPSPGRALYRTGELIDTLSIAVQGTAVVVSRAAHYYYQRKRLRLLLPVPMLRKIARSVATAWASGVMRPHP